jgi:hypothetical protein
LTDDELADALDDVAAHIHFPRPNAVEIAAESARRLRRPRG